MTRKNIWQFVFTIVVLVLFVPFLFPPKGHDFSQDFLAEAKNRDAAFSNIVHTFQAMQATNASRTYGNLKDAVGTNDLRRYFPKITTKDQEYPSVAILQRLQRNAAGKIRLGLDLQGGTRFTLAMDTAKLGTNIDGSTALSHAVEVIRRRVDLLGVAEPVIQPVGLDQIDVQLPGLSESDKERARALIERAAFLEFRMVHPESDTLLSQNIIEPGYEVLSEKIKYKNSSGTEVREVRQLLVNKKPERGLTGANLVRSSVTRDPLNNKLKILFELNKEGADIFEQVTREWQPKNGREFRLAIVLDGKLESAPNIKGIIPGGHGEISGDYTPKEAFDLQSALENPLQAPVRILKESSVDPGLGADTVRKGFQAALFGTLAVAGFMLVYYLLAGVVANIALMLNIVILLGALCALETTLTMPGIAGIVLTIGMAVDANVLIFERIREELAAGKTMRGALSAGYDKAFGTIFDSNLTTLIASVILIFMGTGPVKGFGVTLTVGVLISMFTALVVTRLMFDFLLSRNLLPSLKMLHLIRGAKIDFLKWALPAFIASWLLIFIGNGYGISRGRDVLGVEFTGGDTLTLAFNQKVPQDKVSAAVKALNLGEPTVQYQKDAVTGTEALRITTRVVDEKSTNSVSALVMQSLQKQFPEAGFNSPGFDHIGPSVGREIQKTAVTAALLAMLCILIYVAFRYEFPFAVGAVVAILHDLLMTSGWFFLTGREMSGPFVAAMLTIIGFSINDTIVIFDRIREDLRMGVHGTFKELMNHALNRTLSRTSITSGTVFLATLSLYLFGGGVINDFSFTFLVGILTGTYSSIYIASFIVFKWHKGQRPTLGAGVALENAASARVPEAAPTRA